MGASSIAKKVFWSIFIVILIIVAFLIVQNIYDSIYEKKVNQELKKIGIDLTLDELNALIEERKVDLKPTQDVFVCENDNSVASRAYIILLGLGNHDKETFAEENKVILQDQKVKGIFTYDYNENLLIEEISQDFVEKANRFILESQPEEIVLVGVSAGGNLAVHSMSELDFEGIIELHTVAAPLRGYDLKGVEGLAGKRTGFEREIGIGFEQYEMPSEKTKVYHHKEITEEGEEHSLLSWCEPFTGLCNVLQIQNNNVPESKEFYYPGLNHDEIQHYVLRKIVDCRQ
ncbi:MAG: hypothetical protein U9O94_02780 [Nanoarchaeota archaeon]|nr:hypothetical protein [Nanoarchaeota archaeon]